MKAYLTPLIQFQRFFLPALVCLLLWAIWRAVARKDAAVGLGLYCCVVVIVDGYLNTGIYLPGLEKGSIRFSEVCALFLFMNTGAHPNQSGRRLVTWIAGIYFLLLFVSALRSQPLMAGLLEFRRLIVPQAVAFFLARRGLQSQGAYRRFFLCLTALVLVVGVFDFWDLFFDRWILKSDMLDKPIYFHNRQLKRLGSLFLNPNYLGAFIVLVFPVSFVWTLNEREFWPRVYAWCGLLLLVFCLVETQSRGPLLAFVVGVLLLVVGPCGGVSRRRRVGLLTAFVVVFTLLMPNFYQHAIQRFADMDDETADGRTRATTWLYTLRMIGDHPIGGIGFGEDQFTRTMEEYGFEEEYGVEALDAPHNSYLQATAYGGIPALLAFLLVNAILLRRAALISLRPAIEGTTSTVFGLAVGIVGFLASIVPDLQLFTLNVAPVYWVFVGLLLSLTSAGVAAAPQAAVAAAAVPRALSWWTAEPQPPVAARAARSLP